MKKMISAGAAFGSPLVVVPVPPQPPPIPPIPGPGHAGGPHSAPRFFNVYHAQPGNTHPNWYHLLQDPSTAFTNIMLLMSPAGIPLPEWEATMNALSILREFYRILVIRMDPQGNDYYQSRATSSATGITAPIVANALSYLLSLPANLGPSPDIGPMVNTILNDIFFGTRGISQTQVVPTAFQNAIAARLAQAPTPPTAADVDSIYNVLYNRALTLPATAPTFGNTAIRQERHPLNVGGPYSHHGLHNLNYASARNNIVYL